MFEDGFMVCGKLIIFGVQVLRIYFEICMYFDMFFSETYKYMNNLKEKQNHIYK